LLYATGRQRNVIAASYRIVSCGQIANRAISGILTFFVLFALFTSLLTSENASKTAIPAFGFLGTLGLRCLFADLHTRLVRTITVFWTAGESKSRQQYENGQCTYCQSKSFHSGMSQLELALLK